MFKRMLFLGLLVLAPLTSVAAQENDNGPSDDAQRIARDRDRIEIVIGLNRFGGDIYSRVAQDWSGDIAISPASISTAFGLAYHGARGETANQIASVLHYPGGVADFNKSFGELLRTFQRNDPGRTMAINNAIWVQQGLVLEAKYLDAITANYGAGVNFLNYKADSEAARLAINRWVEGKTNDRIKNLLEKPDVPEDTKNILVNTIYFKADWHDPFKPENTKEGKFRFEKKGSKMLPLMNQRLTYRYAERDKVQMLAMPYRYGDADMVVFLPKKGKLAKLEQQIAKEGFAPWLNALNAGQDHDTILTLPKFKIESKFSLAETLAGMGMQVPFSDNADFLGMYRPPLGELPIKFNKVIHQVFVEVEEKGTEAAAATAITQIVISGRRMTKPPEPKIFKVDHPFLFLIRDRQSNAILFTGRFTGE